MPAALAATRELGWPVVVKPADLDHGEGVTMDVNDEARLKSAFALAQRLSPTRQVIVERQVPGWCHRLFIAREPAVCRQAPADVGHRRRP